MGGGGGRWRRSLQLWFERPSLHIYNKMRLCIYTYVCEALLSFDCEQADYAVLVIWRVRIREVRPLQISVCHQKIMALVCVENSVLATGNTRNKAVVVQNEREREGEREGQADRHERERGELGIGRGKKTTVMETASSA